MLLSKRERVFKALELDGEPDKVPINSFGMEQTGTSFQAFQNSEEIKKYSSWVQPKSSRKKYFITEQRFWNVDVYFMDPFGERKMKVKRIPAPAEYPDCYLTPLDGAIYKMVKQVETGLPYSWYVGGYYTSPEILYTYWDRYGKPSELVNDKVNYSPQVWQNFVEAIEPYFYPMVRMMINPTECLLNGISLLRVSYYMRKNPKFIHDVMNEYTKANIEIIKRCAEAGVDIIFLGDDFGYKDNPIFSPKQFREFLLPYHKKMYDMCKKNGMLTVLHSCGKVDSVLPDLADAGLNCIQSLEASAGVDLAGLKNTLGDRLCFMGGLDSTGTHIFGRPQDVEINVKKCLKDAGYGGGYIIGPSHDILNMPWENILAMRTAIEKYRKYPLKI